MGRLNTLRLRTLMKPGTCGDGNGLYLQVRGPANRSWLYRYQLHGQPHWMGLGTLADVSLAEARDLAAEARKLVRQGIDPLARRHAVRAEQAAQAGLTFAHVAELCVAAHEHGWRNAKHRRQWRQTLMTYAHPIIGHMPVAQIGVGDITRILEPIWLSRTETASRLRGRIEAVLDFAAVRGWRTGENPARWRGHLKHVLPAPAKVAKVQHHAALPWREIGPFMATLAQEEDLAALALRWLILTATRSGEALGVRWSEIDMDVAVWTIPAARMKAARPHRVPLSDAAMAVLRAAETLQTKQYVDCVFPGLRFGHPISGLTLRRVLWRLGRGDLTVHGFRSTFRDWCAEATNYPREVAEAALAHAPRDKTEAAYQRGDMLEKRRRLMNDWALFCARPAMPAEIVPLRAEAAGP